MTLTSTPGPHFERDDPEVEEPGLTPGQDEGEQDQGDVEGDGPEFGPLKWKLSLEKSHSIVVT